MTATQSDLDWQTARAAELRDGGMTRAQAAQTARREALNRNYARWNATAGGQR